VFSALLVNCNTVYQLFRHLPGRDWPAGILMAIQQMRIKQPTTTWSSRRTGQLVDKTAHEIKEVYFGSQMINLAACK